jgi:hypothetical protein
MFILILNLLNIWTIKFKFNNLFSDKNLILNFIINGTIRTIRNNLNLRKRRIINLTKNRIKSWRPIRKADPKAKRRRCGTKNGIIVKKNQPTIG